MEASQINLLLNQITNLNNSLKDTQHGKFTSHCFRRGGAQDAVLHADKYNEPKVSLTRALWWGGWSKGERVDMLAHYLLEQVAAQEDDHGDMEDDVLLNDRLCQFAGGDMTSQQDPVASLRHEIGQLTKQMNYGFKQNNELLAKFGEVLLQASRSAHRAPASGGPQGIHQASADATSSYNEAETFRQLDQLAGTSAAVAIGAAAAARVANGRPINEEGVPLPAKIPEAKTVAQVVIQWERGDARHNLLPLSRWTKAMRQKAKGCGNAQVFSLRKKIYDGYTRRNKDLTAFYQAYGGEGLTLSRYIAAIKKEEKELQALKTSNRSN